MGIFNRGEPVDLSAAQCVQVIRSIGAGQHCLGCGAIWQPDGTGQRRMSHDLECPYTASVDAYDFGDLGVMG